MACKGLGLPEEVLKSIYPIVPATSSDTGAFDSVLELLTQCGRDIPEVCVCARRCGSVCTCGLIPVVLGSV
jgi:hypothetical protein